MIDVGQLLLGHSELHGQRHQLRLGAVVEIPLDLAQGCDRRVNGLGPSVFQGANAHGQGVGREKRSHQGSVEEDDDPGDPGRRKEQEHSGRKDRHPMEEARSANRQVSGSEEDPDRAELAGLARSVKRVGQARERPEPDAERGQDSEEA